MKTNEREKVRETSGKKENERETARVRIQGPLMRTILLLQKRTEMMERWRQQEVQVKESRCAEEIPHRRWKQPKGEDRTEMKKRGKEAEVHLAKWISMEYREEVHEKIQGKCDTFLWLST